MSLTVGRVQDAVLLAVPPVRLRIDHPPRALLDDDLGDTMMKGVDEMWNTGETVCAVYYVYNAGALWTKASHSVQASLTA